jgi:hypothetical protein
MAKAVFHDPQRKRWKRLRILFDLLAAAVSLAIVVFVLSLLHSEPLPKLLLADQKRPYHAIKEKERKHPPPKRASTHRGSKTPPSQVVLNSQEGIRGAFYVTWDAGSFSALKAFYPQIDLLFPEWLHLMSADGRLQGVSLLNTFFDVVQNGKVQPVDDKVMPFLKEAKAETEVFPLVNNFQPITNEWLDISKFLKDPGARDNFRQQLLLFLASDK